MTNMLRTIAWGIVDGEDGTINSRGATLEKVGVGNYILILSENIQVAKSETMAVFTPIDNVDWSAYSLWSVLEEPNRRKNVVWRNNVGIPIDVTFYFEIKKLQLI